MFGQIQYNEDDMVAEEKGQILSIQKMGERRASHTIPIPESYHNTLSFKKGIQYFIKISSLSCNNVWHSHSAAFCFTLKSLQADINHDNDLGFLRLNENDQAILKTVCTRPAAKQIKRSLNHYLTMCLHYHWPMVKQNNGTVQEHDSSLQRWWFLFWCRVDACKRPPPQKRSHWESTTQKLREVMASWSLQEERLVCLTTDNSSNVVKAASLNNWTVLQCFGHRLHLAIDE